MKTQTNPTRTPLDGIFIDFYGTIAAGDRAAVESVCQTVIDTHKLEIDAADLARQWGQTFFDRIEHANGDGFLGLVECERRSLCDLMKNYVADFDPAEPMKQMIAYLQAPPLHEEVPEVLAALTVPAVVVSNVDRQDLDAAIAHHRLRFADTITSEDARSYKPDKNLFEYALARTGWSPDRVLHVGDSLHSDVKGARQVGLSTVWIHRSDRIGDPGQADADYTFPNLRPLIDLVKRHQVSNLRGSLVNPCEKTG